MKTAEPWQVVILAGGLGTRLRPLTHDIPKPMVPTRGIPYLHYQLHYLAEQGYRRFLLLTGHLSRQIEDYFGDGSSRGWEISYSVEPHPLGTGGGLRLALPLLAERFILLYGDSFLPISFTRLQEEYLDNGREGLMVLYDNSELTDVKNNVELDPAGAVVAYDKEDSRGKTHVEAGVLVLTRNLAAEIPAGRKYALEQEKFPRLIADGRMGGFVTRQRFYDIGTPERLKEFEQVIHDYFPNPLPR